jgi:hypothetical protein
VATPAIPSVHTAKGQLELRNELMAKLAELAGITSQLHGDETIKRIAGKQIGLPEGMPLPIARQVIDKAIQDEEQDYTVSFQFKYRPYDGARAVQRVLRSLFGWSVGMPVKTMFGERPPQLITIETDFGVTEQVPWGRLGLPHFEGGYMDLGSHMDPQMGLMFEVTVTVKRKFQDEVAGLFNAINMELFENSIYKGKAITASEQPTFIDTSGIDFEDIVYTEQVQEDIEVFIWANILYPDQLRDINQLGKRLTIIHGGYGGGKTELARLTAKLCMQRRCGFMMVRPGIDNYIYAIQMARLYGGQWVIFIEDADLLARPDNPEGLQVLLDQLDGVMVKGLDISMVFTTNHLDRIQKGVLRPGRTDGLIEIGAMDRPGVEKLARRMIGTNLDYDDCDFDAVFKAMDGFMPAFVSEVFKRAIRRNLVRNKGTLSMLNGHDLIGAANNLRPQLERMHGAPEAQRRTGIDGEFKRMVREAVNDVIDDAIENRVNGATLYNPSGKHLGTIATA